MRVPTKAMLLALPYLLSACAAPEALSGDQVSLTIDSARAISCSDTCKAVALDLTVTNNTSQAICFSVRYISRISNAVILADEGATDTDSFETVADPLEPVNDTPSGAPEFANFLREEPNIFVAPNSRLSFSTSTLDKYNIPKRDRIVVYLPFYVYPCSGSSFQRLQESSPLLFE